MMLVALWLIFGALCLVSVVVMLQLGLIALHLGDLKAYSRMVSRGQQPQQPPQRLRRRRVQFDPPPPPTRLPQTGPVNPR